MTAVDGVFWGYIIGVIIACYVIGCVGQTPQNQLVSLELLRILTDSQNAQMQQQAHPVSTWCRDSDVGFMCSTY